MRYIGRLLARILLGVNVLAVLLMLLSAYSPYWDAQAHPVCSGMGLFFPVFMLANLLFLLFWLVVCRKFSLLSLLAFVVCWNAVRTYVPLNIGGKAAPENAIKILSYNTRGFGEKAAHTAEKPNPVLDYLRQCDADIICLQEYIWGGKLKRKDIDYALRNYRYKHYQPLADGLNGLGCYSRYPILSATPIKFGKTRNGAVAYRIRVGEDTLLVVNNHLESNKILMSDVETYQDMIDAPESRKVLAGGWKLLGKLAEATSIRAEQVGKVLEHLDKFQGKGVVVCGDFNDSPISYAYRMLSENLKDAFVESGCGIGVSYNLHRMPFRIDHILLSRNLDVYECTVDNTTKASDHYPVWCYLSWD